MPTENFDVSPLLVDHESNRTEHYLAFLREPGSLLPGGLFYAPAGATRDEGHTCFREAPAPSAGAGLYVICGEIVERDR